MTSKAAVLLKDAVTIGFCKNVRIGIRTEKIKDYDLGDDEPSIMEYGNMSYTWTFERGYVDKTYGELLTAGTKFALELRPEGTGSGKQKITLSNCVMESWEIREERNAVVLESASGEGKSIAFGTQ